MNITFNLKRGEDLLKYLNEDFCIAYMNLMRKPFFTEKADVLAIIGNITNSNEAACQILSKKNFFEILFELMLKIELEKAFVENFLIIMSHMIKYKDIFTEKEIEKLTNLTGYFITLDEICFKQLSIVILSDIANVIPPFEYMISKRGEAVLKQIKSFNSSNPISVFSSISFIGNLLAGTSAIVQVKQQKITLKIFNLLIFSFF